MRTFRDALVAWLGLLELLVGLGRLWGMSWLGRRGWAARALLAPLGAMAVLRLAQRGWRGRAALALTLPCALALQLGAASARNHRLNPRARLRPGEHEDRRVERVEIALAEGAVP